MRIQEDRSGLCRKGDLKRDGRGVGLGHTLYCSTGPISRPNTDALYLQGFLVQLFDAGN